MEEAFSINSSNLSISLNATFVTVTFELDFSDSLGNSSHISSRIFYIQHSFSYQVF